MVDKPSIVSYNKYRTVNIEKRITYKPKPKSIQLSGRIRRITRVKREAKKESVK